MRRPPLSILLLAAAIVPAPAAATDFTFTVPVRIERMEHATSAWVSCSVLPSTRSISVGQRTDVPLVDGGYSGTVTVDVDTGAAFLPEDASRWLCSLNYAWRMPDGTTSTISVARPDERNPLYTRYTGQEVISSSLSAEGTIPR